MYRLYLVDYEKATALFDLYCQAKPWVWRLFFGWRKANRHGAYYRLTEKQYKLINEIAMEVLDYEVL